MLRMKIIKGIIVILILFSCLYCHELKHYNIYKSYGCKDISINYLDGVNAVSVSANCNHLDKETNNFIDLAQGNQEMDYILFAILIMLGLIFIGQNEK